MLGAYGGRSPDRRLELTAVSEATWIVRDLRVPDSDTRSVVAVAQRDGGGISVEWVRRGRRTRCGSLADVLALASGELDAPDPEE